MSVSKLTMGTGHISGKNSRNLSFQVYPVNINSQQVKADENLLKISIFHKVCIVREGDTFHFKDKKSGNNE